MCVCVCGWVGGCKSTRCVFVSMRAPTSNFSSLSLSGGEAEGGAGGFPGEGEGEGGEASKRRKAAATAGPERWRGAATEDCGGCNDDLRMKATPRRGAEDVRRRRGYGRHPECAGRSGWSLAAMKALVAVLLARLPGNLGALDYTGVWQRRMHSIFCGRSSQFFLRRDAVFADCWDDVRDSVRFACAGERGSCIRRRRRPMRSTTTSRRPSVFTRA